MTITNDLDEISYDIIWFIHFLPALCTKYGFILDGRSGVEVVIEFLQRFEVLELKRNHLHSFIIVAKEESRVNGWVLATWIESARLKLATEKIEEVLLIKSRPSSSLLHLPVEFSTGKCRDKYRQLLELPRSIV